MTSTKMKIRFHMHVCTSIFIKDYKTEVGVQMTISWSKLTQIDSRGRISLYMLLARRILIGVLKIRVLFWAAVALT
jgi:hypothetical protein